MNRLDGQNLCILRNGKALFDPLSLQINAGEVCALMGASGTGKSSLIGYIAGLIPVGLVGQGTVTLNGRLLNDCPTEQRRVGLLFQDDLLFPHLSVAGNLSFGLPKNIAKLQRRQLIDAALADCGLAGYADADPAALSGGQRARVAMQRTLLSEPQCLLLDEPFNALDTALRAQFRDYVFAHVARYNLPCLMVSHDSADTEHEAVKQLIALKP